MKYAKGISLLEILIATSILFMISGATYLCFQQGVRLYQSEKIASSFREGSIALDEMARELGSGAEHLFTKTEELYPPGSSLITFRKYYPLENKRETICYSLNKEKQEVLRTVYASDVDLENPLKQKITFISENTKILARGISSLSFYMDEDYLLGIVIQSSGQNVLLETKVRNQFIPKENFILKNIRLR